MVVAFGIVRSCVYQARKDVVVAAAKRDVEMSGDPGIFSIWEVFVATEALQFLSQIRRKIAISSDAAKSGLAGL